MADAPDSNGSLYPTNVHSVQRDEAGTANDLACEQENEEQSKENLDGLPPRPVAKKMVNSPEKVWAATSRSDRLACRQKTADLFMLQLPPSPLNTLTARISALELQTAEPERKQAAKLRKKSFREAQKVLERKDCSSEVKLEELFRMFQLQARTSLYKTREKAAHRFQLTGSGLPHR